MKGKIMNKEQNAGRLLVTGATGGMGRVCAQLAAARGYDLVLADLSTDRLEAVAARCREHSVNTECHTLDVTRADAIDKLAAALAAANVDAVVHTVGVSPQMAGWQQIIAIDLVGTVALLEAARPHLAAGGAAVAISSMSGHMVPPNDEIDEALAQPLAAGLMQRLQSLAALEHPGMAYAYAKRALQRYVADQAQSWGAEGKRLVSISPGLIDTEMGRLENAAMENFEGMKSLVALGRLGRPEDIAEAALFLASPQAAYITGCDILVDGGFVANFNKPQRRGTGS
jgi:NAD(P)-dependent dehydrogenase (short-subunit alcohol dehydrogenase family)